jgi:hypothetical protein
MIPTLNVLLPMKNLQVIFSLVYDVCKVPETTKYKKKVLFLPKI